MSEVRDTCKCGAEFRFVSATPRQLDDRHREWLEAHAVCRQHMERRLADIGPDVTVEEVVSWAAVIDSLEGAAGGSPSERAIAIAHAILEADQ